MMTALAAAEAELLRRQPARALVVLLEAWREAPAVELAALIDVTSKLVTRSLEPLTTPSEWLTVGSQRRPEDVGRLLASLDDCGLTRLRKRFEVMQTFPRDPRIAPALLRALVRLPFSSVMPFWTLALAVAVSADDARILEVFREVTSPKARVAVRSGTIDYDAVDKRIAKAAAAIHPAPELDGDAHAAVKRCKEAAAQLAAQPPISAKELAAPPTTKGPTADAGLGEKLLAAVYASPNDATARQVYADWLLERGDPRGELIVLQCKAKRTAAEQKRERALLKEHALTWSEPLGVALARDRVRFARGFLDACAVRCPTRAVEKQLAGHPVWSTVREIETKHMDLLLDPCMKSMRRATLTGAALSKLAARPEPQPLEAVIGPCHKQGDGQWVSAGMAAGDIGTWKRALAVGSLVSLRAVSLAQVLPEVDDVRWLLDSALGRQLTTLEVCTDRGGSLAPWMPLVEQGALTRVILRMDGINHGGALVLERGGCVRLQTAGWLTSVADPQRAPWLEEVFDSVRPRRVVLEYILPTPRRLHRPGWDAITTWLGERFDAPEVSEAASPALL